MQRLKPFALLALLALALAGCVVHPHAGYGDHGRRWGWHDRGPDAPGKHHHRGHWRRW